MKREEEIEQAARILAATKRTAEAAAQCEYDFKIGAEWADTHPQDRWISVEDKLPPLRQRVLAYNGVTERIAWLSDDFMWRTDKEYCFRTYPVTHWMPLPQPPVVSKMENTGCKNCMVADYPPCGKGIPCCKCDEQCNSRQPCQKKGGEQ